MGKREDQQTQKPLWIALTELASVPGHPFHEKLNELLDAKLFDAFVEGLSAKFYAKKWASIASSPHLLSVAMDWIF